MSYLPIKKAAKYLSKETGIKFSTYELAKLGGRDAFKLYLDGVFLDSRGYSYTVATDFLYEIIGSIDPRDILELPLVHEIEDQVCHDTFLFNNSYASIDSPVLLDEDEIEFNYIFLEDEHFFINYKWEILKSFLKDFETTEQQIDIAIEVVCEVENKCKSEPVPCCLLFPGAEKYDEFLHCRVVKIKDLHISMIDLQNYIHFLKKCGFEDSKGIYASNLETQACLSNAEFVLPKDVIEKEAEAIEPLSTKELNNEGYENYSPLLAVTLDIRERFLNGEGAGKGSKTATINYLLESYYPKITGVSKTSIQKVIGNFMGMTVAEAEVEIAKSQKNQKK